MPKLFNYHRYENLFDSNQIKSLLEYCEKNKNNFHDAAVRSKGELKTDKEFRVCLINLDLGEFREIFEKKISQLLEDIYFRLKIKKAENTEFELQLTAHGDGAFFKQHIDTHTEYENNSKSRVLSAVFYFFNEPKQFEGGELVLHPFNFLEGNDIPIKLAPINNSLVVFPSFGLHEVLPIVCPNKEFKFWRFAINCWLNKI